MTFLWYNPADDAQGARNATSAERPSGRPCATGTNPRKQKMKTAKKRLASFLSTLMAAGSLLAAFEHVAHDAVSLNGDWEMAYLPYACESVKPPAFAGVRVANAVPGYWEDMREAFREAGMTDNFRVNPWYERQVFPISGSAADTTLPDIYGCFFYRRHVKLGRTGPAVLHFGGVRNQVHVWINGRFVAFRAGFSTPFELPVPDGILKAGANEIVLAVSNNPNLGYGDHVSGLTTRSVFRSTGGVNGDLELRFLKSDIADVYVTTAGDLATFTVHVSGTDSYTYEIADGGRILASGAGRGDFTLPADGYDFWSPERPKRYELRLKTANGSYAQRFGLRRLVADGEKLRLNGLPVYLRGVTEHCYFAKTVHVPRDLDYYRMVTAKRKELGFNFVRFHTWVPPKEYLEAMDELGMLVHIESPNFVSEPEYAAIIAFARRHPSVVIYCTGNETRIDRLAETYLEDVAKLVHDGTDALFSPMSAMRGVEYLLIPGKDVIVGAPFPHNPERMRRLSRYCDLWTSYQLGLASYGSLNSGSSAALDAWGDAYCGKPRTSHEICIDGSYVDLSLENDYPPDSPILREGIFSGARAQLRAKGLLDRADAYFRNSCEWMRRIRKFTFEKVRAAGRVAGYDFLGDINTHWHTFGYSVGMMDEFYRLKPGETVKNVLRYNSAAVVLSDLGSDFNVRAGEKKSVKISISNYAGDAKDATLRVSLVAHGKELDARARRRRDAGNGAECAWDCEKHVGDVKNGEVVALGEFDVEVPTADKPAKYLLRASFSGGAVKAENEWEIYAFPSDGRASDFRLQASGHGTGGKDSSVRVVDDISIDGLLAAMARGERMLLLGAGPFKSLPTTFRIGMAGRCTGNLATVIKAGHPVFRDFPHDGYCGWQFRRLIEGGRAVQLEAGVPFNPIVDVASSVKNVIRQAALFEYRIGEGRLLVCSFNLSGTDPAAAWLKRRLLDYAASDAFEPELGLTPEEARSVMAAPLLTGESNSNVARNPNDPSSTVRAANLAQP